MSHADILYPLGASFSDGIHYNFPHKTRQFDQNSHIAYSHITDSNIARLERLLLLMNSIRQECAANSTIVDLSKGIPMGHQWIPLDQNCTRFAEPWARELDPGKKCTMAVKHPAQTANWGVRRVHKENRAKTAKALSLTQSAPMIRAPTATTPALNRQAGPTVPPPKGACDDSCAHSNDGTCDDDGPGSLHERYGVVARCLVGTDCSDCGKRSVSRSSESAPMTPAPTLPPTFEPIFDFFIGPRRQMQCQGVHYPGSDRKCIPVCMIGNVTGQWSNKALVRQKMLFSSNIGPFEMQRLLQPQNLPCKTKRQRLQGRTFVLETPYATIVCIQRCVAVCMCMSALENRLAPVPVIGFGLQNLTSETYAL